MTELQQVHNHVHCTPIILPVVTWMSFPEILYAEVNFASKCSYLATGLNKCDEYCEVYT